MQQYRAKKKIRRISPARHKKRDELKALREKGLAPAPDAAPPEVPEVEAAPEPPAPEPVAEEEPEPEAPVVEAAPVHLLEGSITSLVKALEDGSHDAHLAKLLEAEEAGKNRKGAKAALQERIDALV